MCVGQLALRGLFLLPPLGPPRLSSFAGRRTWTLTTAKSVSMSKIDNLCVVHRVHASVWIRHDRSKVRGGI
jgi:hypothetical protein